jgi:hypothetical protein
MNDEVVRWKSYAYLNHIPNRPQLLGKKVGIFAAKDVRRW